MFVVSLEGHHAVEHLRRDQGHQALDSADSSLSRSSFPSALAFAFALALAWATRSLVCNVASLASPCGSDLKSSASPHHIVPDLNCALVLVWTQAAQRVRQDIIRCFGQLVNSASGMCCHCCTVLCVTRGSCLFFQNSLCVGSRGSSFIGTLAWLRPGLQQACHQRCACTLQTQANTKPTVWSCCPG